jgi:hypothetical protein
MGKVAKGCQLVLILLLRSSPSPGKFHRFCLLRGHGRMFLPSVVAILMDAFAMMVL